LAKEAELARLEQEKQKTTQEVILQYQSAAQGFLRFLESRKAEMDQFQNAEELEKFFDYGAPEDESLQGVESLHREVLQLGAEESSLGEPSLSSVREAYDEHLTQAQQRIRALQPPPPLLAQQFAEQAQAFVNHLASRRSEMESLQGTPQELLSKLEEFYENGTPEHSKLGALSEIHQELLRQDLSNDLSDFSLEQLQQMAKEFSSLVKQYKADLQAKLEKLKVYHDLAEEFIRHLASRQGAIDVLTHDDPQELISLIESRFAQGFPENTKLEYLSELFSALSALGLSVSEPHTLSHLKQLNDEFVKHVKELLSDLRSQLPIEKPKPVEKPIEKPAPEKPASEKPAAEKSKPAAPSTEKPTPKPVSSAEKSAAPKRSSLGVSSANPVSKPASEKPKPGVSKSTPVKSAPVKASPVKSNASTEVSREILEVVPSERVTKAKSQPAKSTPAKAPVRKAEVSRELPAAVPKPKIKQTKVPPVVELPKATPPPVEIPEAVPVPRPKAIVSQPTAVKPRVKRETKSLTPVRTVPTQASPATPQPRANLSRLEQLATPKTPKNLDKDTSCSFSPEISPYARKIKRQQTAVFSNLYNHSVDRRAKQKSNTPSPGQFVPKISSTATKYGRTGDVFEILWADAMRRKEHQKQLEEQRLLREQEDDSWFH
jgi:hypothetical protein